MKKEYVMGVDLGTGSVRAGIFSFDGKLHGYGAAPVKIWYPAPDFVEQSSDNFWESTCRAVRKALNDANLTRKEIIGISFDATCSLVTLDENDKPLTVSPTRRNQQNVIVWMDHRAKKEAEFINSTKHEVLKYVGGKMSPEQEPPKLLWLKNNLKDTWEKASKFFDLADYATYRATGIDTRSLCTVVCKWGYMGHLGKHGCWDESFYSRIGLDELLREEKIGKVIRPMGTWVGNLTKLSAMELGLSEKTAVGAGIIDAHAGGLGVIGTPLQENEDVDLTDVLCQIAGTSSCHMAVSREPVFVPGVWGPYYSAMIPGMWLTEGGQTATGALVDFMIQSNSLYRGSNRAAKRHNETIYQYLNRHLDDLSAENAELTRDIHILPYFHGNRSPRADPNAKGMISGLTLSNTLDSYATRYLATIQSIAYGTRHIMEEMNDHGHHVRMIAACGGGAKNRYFIQQHADATGRRIYLAKQEEAVLLGDAILAASAVGEYSSVEEACRRMSAKGKVIEPDTSHTAFHERKYRVFKLMYEHLTEYNKIMET
jgi:FGGY-family pentulose kinase